MWFDTADKHTRDFQAFLSQTFPPGNKRVYYQQVAIKELSSADENLRCYMRKNNFQLLNLLQLLKSFDARDILVVQAMEQVILQILN